MVRLLVAMGQSVLLASYTHSAVDTILLKLNEKDDTKFLRLGRQSRIDERLLHRSAEAISEKINDLDELRQVYSSCPVIATTCLGLNHPAIQQRTFDFCILDEAGQSTFLSALGPLFHASKFILVGDPKQLPPVVQSMKARNLGFEKSLFSHLTKESNTIPLNVQYRMNSCVMACANELVYEGKLEAGSDEVANRTLSISTDSNDNLSPWMEKVLSDDLADSVLFFDTSQLSALEVVDAHGVTNPTESKIVSFICLQLQHRGLSSSNIGAIAPYRAQVNLLRQNLANISIDVKTVDQFQGRDKEVIIYSCTRSKSNPSKLQEVSSSNAPDILADLRRLNVAVTRAKCKLILIGNRETLIAYEETFGKLLQILSKTRHIIPILPNDLGIIV